MVFVPDKSISSLNPCSAKGSSAIFALPFEINHFERSQECLETQYKGCLHPDHSSGHGPDASYCDRRIVSGDPSPPLSRESCWQTIDP